MTTATPAAPALAYIPVPLSLPDAVHHEVTRSPGLVGTARRAARRVLTGWSITGDRLDDALLIVSELVTNALVHGGTGPVGLILREVRGCLTVAVRDCGPSTSTLIPCPQNAAAESGRGLAIVARLARQCGACSTPRSTTVWARL
ncbi:ATP-binding protein [Streptomyces olivaceus]|uniref:ATP-binding protein n=1 Tax=Streptomyces olivaceus TaxID=47716 RepID=UPI003628892E